MTFNNLFWQVVQPSQLILIVAIVAALFWRRPVGRKLAGATVALVLVSAVPLGSFLIAPLENRFEIPRDLAGVDGIIVLSGSEHVERSRFRSQPQIGEAGDRLTTFLALANAHPQARLVHSGAFESEIARTLLLGAGIPPTRIVFEDRSRNTCESAPATRDLVAPLPTERWLLVTSAAHMPRAVACFRAAHWSVIPYPTDFRSGPPAFAVDLVGNLETLDAAAHEWLGLAYYRLRGYTDDLYPAPEPAMIQP